MNAGRPGLDGFDDRSVPVVLTGFMGTGKSTTGRILADRLGHRFIDTDTIIEERHGPIPEIFAREGEEGFRDRERVLAAELADAADVVISTGGRFMLDPANQASLGRRARTFSLLASAATILQRVGDDGTVRPLLAGPDPAGRVRSLLAERADGYRRFPSVITDDRTANEVADRLHSLVTAPPSLVGADGRTAIIGPAVLAALGRRPVGAAVAGDEIGLSFARLVTDRVMGLSDATSARGPIVVMGSAAPLSRLAGSSTGSPLVHCPLRLSQIEPLARSGADRVVIELGALQYGEGKTVTDFEYLASRAEDRLSIGTPSRRVGAKNVENL